jgi:hypothetical protein
MPEVSDICYLCGDFENRMLNLLDIITSKRAIVFFIIVGWVNIIYKKGGRNPASLVYACFSGVGFLNKT